MPGPLPRANLHIVALLAIVGLAAALRFAGLGYEVRHPPHYDDRVFVNNVIEMLAAGDADHRYYEYPGLFFYLLALPIGAVRPERMDDPSAYLAARALVAVFGVVSVALVYQVGCRIAGRGVGLAAALLLAVSPNEVAAAHTNRPDVVLQAATLVAYLSLLRLGRDWRGDLRAALWIGAGTAIKFTGFLLFPSYLLARAQAPGPRVVRMAAVGLIAALVVVAATPFALVHPEAYLGGVSHQMGAHYQESLKPSTYVDNLITYARWIERPLGVPATVLALLGAALALRSGHPAWLALLVHAPLTVLVMSSAGIVAPRFLIPASGAVCLAVGFGVRALSRGRALAALALALVAAAAPLGQSLDRVRPLLEPSPRDAALDWIERNLPTGSRILETRADAPSELRAQLIGADPRRYELLFRPASWGGLQLLAPHMDLVVAGPGGGVRWSQELRTVFRGEKDGKGLFELKVPVAGARPRYVRLEARGMAINASAQPASLAALLDRDPATIWSSSRSLMTGDWIEVAWAEPAPLARLELHIANQPSREPELRILTRGADGVYRPRAAIPAREPVAQQLAAGRPASQVFLLGPEPVSGLRLQVESAPAEPWALSELELSIRVPPAIQP